MSISITILFSFLLISFSFAQTTCNRGTYLTKSGTCKQCPPGFYQEKYATKATSCQPCEGGTYFPFEGAQTGAVCQPCADDTFSEPGSASCTKCPPGTISKVGSSICVKCKPGQQYGYSDSENNPCIDCEPNTYNPVENGECLRCPPGHLSPPGSSSVDQCKKCPDGQAADYSENKCTSCDKNQMQVFDPVTRECSNPPGGIFLPNGKFKLCKPGEYEIISGNESGFGEPFCKKCPDGYTTYSPGMRFCRAIGFKCPPNYVELPSGDCFSCDPGMRYLKDSHQCAYCPDGTASRGGGDETCTPCEKLLEDGFKTDFCPSFDTLVPRTNGSCPAGTHIFAKYPTLCEKCSMNTYSDGTNSVQCATCPMDEYQPSDMAVSCKKCPKGTVRWSDFDVNCVIPQTGCQIGKELVGRDFPSCIDLKKCPGPRPPNIFHDGCYACSPKFEPDPKEPGGCRMCGDLQVSDGRKCEQCPGETVIDGVMGSTCGCRGVVAVNRGIINGECKVCPPGMYGSSTGVNSDNKCVKCPAGLVREVIDEAVIVNTAMNRFGVMPKPCVPCPLGYYTHTEGAAKCEKCPNGTTSYGLGETECVGKIDSQGDDMVYKIESSDEPVESMEESVDVEEEVESPQPTGEILFPDLDLDMFSV